MKPSNVIENLSGLSDVLVDWLRCVKSPSEVCRMILVETDSDHEIPSSAIRLWLTSYVLVIFLNGWIFQSYGIALSNIGFYVSRAVTWLLYPLIFTASIQCGFKLFRVRVSFKHVFTILMVYSAAALPFLAILTAPEVSKWLYDLNYVKENGGSIADVAKKMWEQLTEDFDPHEYTAFEYMELFFAGITMPYLTAVAACALRTIAHETGNKLTRVFSSGSFAIGFLAAIPTVIIGFAEPLVIFAFM